jgi:Cu+-exporting ATPase
MAEKDASEKPAGCCCGNAGGGAKSADLIATDPVCTMPVDPARTVHRVEQNGQTYYFCCGGCRAKFAADPGKYLNKGESPATAAMGHGSR